MNRRRCGKSDLELPVLGVGCWSFGGGDYWGAQDQRDADAVVARALELGCNYFDTAEAYNDGASETSLGLALKGRRDEAIIGTKISPSNTAPKVLRAHCEDSLRRLATDRIDLYMVHWPINRQSVRQTTDDEAIINNPPSTAEAFATLMTLRQEGKIRHVGVSNFGAKQLAEAMAGGAEIAVNQLSYSLLTRAIEVEILPSCRANGVGIIGYVPLMQGMLTGKYHSADDVPPKRARIRHFSGSRPGSRHGEAGVEAETFQTIERIGQIAAGHDMSMSDIALAWCAVREEITCVLAGARNLAQFEANAGAMVDPLPAAAVEQLNAATAPIMARLGPSADYFEGTQNSRIR